jgi:hypothetical protein
MIGLRLAQKSSSFDDLKIERLPSNRKGRERESVRPCERLGAFLHIQSLPDSGRQDELRCASSSRAIDHTDQSGSFVTKSRITFVSTRVTSDLATRHRQDGIGAEPLACVTAQTRETARARLSSNLDEDNAAIRRPLKIDHAPGLNAKQIPYGFRDRDLPLGCDRRRHLIGL